MKLKEIISKINAKAVVGDEDALERDVVGGYVSDLLSDVMGRAREGDVWLTIQTHPNVAAVAMLLNLSAVIFTSDQMPEPLTVQKAQEEGVVLLTTPMTTFEVAGRLYPSLAKDV